MNIQEMKFHFLVHCATGFDKPVIRLLSPGINFYFMELNFNTTLDIFESHVLVSGMRRT